MNEHPVIEHIEANCNIRDCSKEAIRFFDAANTPLESQTDLSSTFYLCEDHNDLLATNDEHYAFISERTGRVIIREMGVYSCDPKCATCN